MRIGLGLRFTLWRRAGTAAAAVLSALLTEGGDQIATEGNDILILE